MDSGIRYARGSGSAIAYQVTGEGPDDLVFVPDFMSNLVYGWEWPRWRSFYQRLAGLSRLILFDKRGTGLSDHTGAFPTLETRMEDLRAVLDAALSRRAYVLAAQEGCAMAALFAATYPERTKGLILFQPSVTGAADDPVSATHGATNEQTLAMLSELRDRWGTQDFCDELLFDIAPTLAADEQERVWFANWLRVGASPSAAYALNRMYVETDLRDVLPAVRVPTLLLHRGSITEGPANDVAARMPDARLVRVPGEDVWGIFLSEEVLTEVGRFLADTPGQEETDRVLATLLFTDLVGSTTRATALGDSAWRDLLRRHHDCVRQELARHRGREVDTVGDGFFATFDGPARAIRCADAIRRRLADLDLGVRAGVHTGECELVDDKPAGVAVHTAARVMAQAGAGEIVVTSAVKDLVAGSGISFGEGTEHSLKGLPSPVRLHRVGAL